MSSTTSLVFFKLLLARHLFLPLLNLAGASQTPASLASAPGTPARKHRPFLSSPALLAALSACWLGGADLPAAPLCSLRSFRVLARGKGGVWCKGAKPAPLKVSMQACMHVMARRCLHLHSPPLLHKTPPRLFVCSAVGKVLVLFQHGLPRARHHLCAQRCHRELGPSGGLWAQLRGVLSWGDTLGT